MLQPGDKVAIIDEAIEGTVIRVQAGLVAIETTEGFLMEFDQSEVVKLEAEDIFRGPVPLSSILKEKEEIKPKLNRARKSNKKGMHILEVDLHLEAIMPAGLYLEDYQKLPYQLNFARERLEKAMDDRIPKMVFIHGKGDGILEVELSYLLSRYKNINFYPADYRKYKGGAVEVYFKQNWEDS